MASFAVWMLLSAPQCFAYASIRISHFTFQIQPELRRTQDVFSCKNTSIIACTLTCIFTPNCSAFNVGGWKVWVDDKHFRYTASTGTKGDIKSKSRTEKSESHHYKKVVTVNAEENTGSCQKPPPLDHGRWRVSSNDRKHVGTAECVRDHVFCGHQREITCSLDVGTWTKMRGRCCRNMWRDLTFTDIPKYINISCQLNHRTTIRGTFTELFSMVLRNADMPNCRATIYLRRNSVQVLVFRYTEMRHRFLESLKYNAVKPGQSFALRIRTTSDSLQYTLNGKKTTHHIDLPGFLDGVDNLVVHNTASVEMVAVYPQSRDG